MDLFEKIIEWFSFTFYPHFSLNLIIISKYLNVHFKIYLFKCCVQKCIKNETILTPLF